MTTEFELFAAIVDDVSAAKNAGKTVTRGDILTMAVKRNDNKVLPDNVFFAVREVTKMKDFPQFKIGG